MCQYNRETQGESTLTLWERPFGTCLTLLSCKFLQTCDTGKLQGLPLKTERSKEMEDPGSDDWDIV